MALHLQTRFAPPLEREYEAWIVSGIERYLKSLNIRYSIWAISPYEEAVWPADEKLLLNSKFVGLQFKQAKMAKGVINQDRLNWKLHQPSGQFALVKKHPEIFYCLPTFINRDFREQAVEHCLFWRPDSADDLNVWYDNPKAHTPYKKVRDSMRWGLFVEQIISCNLGRVVDKPDVVRDIVGSIRSSMASFEWLRESDAPRANVPFDGGLYALLLERRG
jgi:hypothetical protein